MKTVNIILDTDIGSDCDDMAALAYLVYAKRYLEVNIAAITYSHTSEYGVGCIRAFFRNMRENCPPIGVGDIVEGSRDFYCRRICEEFGGKKYEAASDGAVRVLRKALVNNERSVICAIGPMTNIAALLKSAPDDISELDGVRLVEQKCDRIIMMAGDFSYLGGGLFVNCIIIRR